MKNKTILLLFSVFIFVSCRKNEKSNNEKPLIVCTTGMIADGLENIVGDFAEVKAIMGEGTDPHLYKATPSDQQLLMRADVIVYNGLHLEGKMADILEKLSQTKNVISMTEKIDVHKLRKIDELNAHDPHVWFDVALWMECLNFTSQKLTEIYPNQKKSFDGNSANYLGKLMELNKEIVLQMQSIPKERRVLITAHDAFGYFGNAYDCDVKGLKGISTLSSIGLKEVNDLADYIVAKKIKAVFVESSVPKKNIESLVEQCKEKGQNVIIGGSLYSDAMGPKESKEGNYIGMVKYNVATVVNSLK